MYQQLRVNCNKYTFNSFDEMDDKLRNLSSIYFVNLPEDRLKYLLKIENTVDFIKYILELNFCYLTKRYSHRFKRTVNHGGSDKRYNTSRSVVDLFMIAIHYRPEIKLQDVYIALAELQRYNYLSTSICSTIHKRVYSYNSFMANNNPQLKIFSNLQGIQKLSKDELGVIVAIDYNNKKYYYEHNDVTIPQPVQNTVSSS